METSLIVPVWQVIVFAIVFAGSYAVIAYMTKINNKNIGSLFDKCDAMMEEEVARRTFVTFELYKNEVDHLNNTLEDVKTQNTQILSILTSKSN